MDDSANFNALKVFKSLDESVNESYPSTRAASDRWMTLARLPDSTEHDLNKSSFLSIREC